MKKNRDLCFLVFSDDWAVHPSSCQHIFKIIAQQYPVLWVNTVGMRTPKFSFYDLKKIVLKLKRMIFGQSRKTFQDKKTLSLDVLQPFMLPFLDFPGVRKANYFSVKHAVNKKLRNLELEKPILVITAPNAVDFIDSFDVGKVVYYSVDDYSEWPGLNKGLVREMEEVLIRKADIQIATSEDLISRIKMHGKDAQMLTHGVDVGFFSSLPKSVHPLLDNVPSPRVGYFGLFDRRSDTGLLLELSGLMPDVSFVITGNVEGDVSELQSKKNIYFTGAVPYAELPAMAQGYDVCMLPYRQNKLTDAIQPLKFKEYIATGKPIVSTPIKEALRLKEYIIIANGADEWVKSICLCLDGEGDGSRDKREQFLQGESWDDKARLFLEMCI